ncbi:hypothetical protein [Streptomyces sp. SID5910]|uniref:hypothetical protein n=1 Tax=Streptomyces sp. SID5910 TaxID=2690312 RepID=UPI00136CC2CA|nr:hypothetical protein [Streptomyces sp. SID5910]MYR43047.1 hypothetical protein [Streptomyces sp. SID5910]
MEDLLREFAEVHRLAIITDEVEGFPRRREYLLRRAAVADRFEIACPHEPTAKPAANTYALRLLEYDAKLKTSRGPLEPEDPQWVGRPRDYVRQEYDAWVLGGSAEQPQDR